MSAPFDPNGHYGIAEMVPVMFGRSRKWWSENSKRLYAAGFPKPISPFGHPRWSGDRLNAWHDRDHEAASETVADIPPSVTNLRAILRQRAMATARKQA